MDAVEIENAKDELEAQRKRCEIGLIIIEAKRDDLLPTILEDMAQAQQDITERYCVME